MHVIYHYHIVWINLYLNIIRKFAKLMAFYSILFQLLLYNRYN